MVGVYEKSLKSKILIVEDYSIVARDIKERLEHMDYNVLDIVSNGEDAIKKSNETKPDVVLMDIVLKGDLDGMGLDTSIQLALYKQQHLEQY